MNDINRRTFIQASAGATIGLAAGATQATVSAKRRPTDKVALGDTGVQVTRLGMGTGTHGWNRQSDQTRLGFAKLTKLFRHAYDAGVRFFDLADLYGSHLYMREALRAIPREDVTILTKIWWRYGEKPKPIVERFLHELDTDYLDIVLLHCVTEPDWDKSLAPHMDYLSALKEKKKVRAVGTSCHTLDALKVAAQSPWVEVDLARINPKGIKMDGPPAAVAPVLAQMHKADKGVLGIKIFGEGQLVDRKEASLRYVFGLGTVDAVSIGFDAPEQIDEVIRLMANVL